MPGLTVVEGAAPAALAGLPRPDAIFIGGGGSDAGVLDAAIDALQPGGRLVANAVTLEMEALLLAKHAALGGELVRIAISRETPVGSMSGWRPAMPVTQWCVGEAMIVAGIGSRKGVSAAEVLAAIDAALQAAWARRAPRLPPGDGAHEAGRGRDHCRWRGGSDVPRHRRRRRGAEGSGRQDAQPFRSVAVMRPARRRSRKRRHSRRRATARGWLGPRLAVGPVTCAIAFGGDEQ